MILQQIIVAVTGRTPIFQIAAAHRSSGDVEIYGSRVGHIHAAESVTAYGDRAKGEGIGAD